MNDKTQAPAKGRRSAADALIKALKAFASMIPQLVGVMLLIGLFQTFVTSDMIASFFSGSILRDSIVGSLVGSISGGNPVTSYIIGGELIAKHVSLVAVTAFIVAWVTVGVIQLQIEASFLGNHFAVIRNTICFFLAIAVALANTLTLELLK
ncbi:MAG: permease [Deltaproteobacteria bacterium]|nr:permease [Deltaproteobacteria bacterium]